MAEPLARLQRAFAAHIRDPERQPAPGDVEDRRMQIYRRLFFNNIRDLLAGNFPVLKSLLDEAAWSQLVRDFYAEHRASTPLFPEIAREFLRYLESARRHRAGDPPFLTELAHYEWVELALSIEATDLGTIPVRRDGAMLQEVPVLSPLAWPLSYRFPVHRIRPDYQPGEAPAEMTHLLVYRDRSDEVRFMELNSMTRLLLALLEERPEFTGLELLRETAQRSRHPRPELILEKGAGLLAEFLERDVLLGFRC